MCWALHKVLMIQPGVEQRETLNTWGLRSVRGQMINTDTVWEVNTERNLC